ncbi:CBS domain-containing protein [Candidatus Bathyarchaeota archaeon]|nr:CBS domain-containing protein [Candidatus Bathyarchaeota archaeon]
MPDIKYNGPRVRYIDLAEDKVFMADPSTPVQELAGTMVEHWIDSIFIVDKGEKLLGIVTDGVLLTLIARDADLSEKTAKEIMATPVYSVKQDDPILPYSKLVETFSKRHNRVNRLAIVDEQDRLVGVLNMNILKKIGRFSRSYEITLKKKTEED